MNRLIPVSLLAVLASACATTRAQTPQPRPALEVPPVPPRVIEPPPAEAPPPEPVVELPPPPTTPPRTRPPTRETAQRENAKPDPKIDAPPVDAQPQPAPASPVAPLRTPGTGDGAQAERLVRDIIDRAGALLQKVDYRRLSVERRKAYDDAKRFMQQAEDAIKAANFDFARNLADKAETLAKELQGR